MTVRRTLWMAGAMIAVALGVLLSFNLPAGLDREARAAEVTGHERRLEALAADMENLEGRMDEARTDLRAQTKENDASRDRISNQERRIEELNGLLDELEG